MGIKIYVSIPYTARVNEAHEKQQKRRLALQRSPGGTSETHRVHKRAPASYCKEAQTQSRLARFGGNRRKSPILIHGYTVSLRETTHGDYLVVL